MSSINNIFIERYFFICLILFFSLLISTWLRLRHVKLKDCDSCFRDNPGSFHEHYIACYGKVERVLKDRFSYLVKRYIKNAVFSILKISSSKGRFEHQRLIITSPQLRRNETLLVTHNVKFGRIATKRGDWVKICGEYIHRQGFCKGFWGSSRTFYGLVHNTHEPFGFIRVLQQEPILDDVGEVQVIEDPKALETKL